MIKGKTFQRFALVLLAGFLIGAAADRAISRLDVRAMSNAERNRQVRKDLMSILLPSKSLYNSNRLSLEGDVWLHSKASATEYQSLCQRDTVLLYYAPINKSEHYEEWRSRPYKIESKRSYRFVSAPRPDYIEAIKADGYERSPFATECWAAGRVIDDNEWGGWFEAGSPELAMDGGFAMLALIDWSKQPVNQFGNCIGDPDPAQCRARAASSLHLNQIGAVEKCTPEKPGEECMVLGNYGSLFTIRAQKTGKPMKAEDIRSVDYEDQIIVT